MMRQLSIGKYGGSTSNAEATAVNREMWGCPGTGDVTADCREVGSTSTRDAQLSTG
jgi:hypothetical protein